MGQRVVFPKYTGTDAKMLGEDLFIIPEHDVLAIVETIEIVTVAVEETV